MIMYTVTLKHKYCGCTKVLSDTSITNVFKNNNLDMIVLLCWIEVQKTPAMFHCGTAGAFFVQLALKDMIMWCLLSRHYLSKATGSANCATDRTVLRSKTDAERSERTP
jgi:hypothetical protein